MENLNLKKMAKQATVKFVCSKGWEVLEKDWKSLNNTIDVVAEDEFGQVHFIETYINTEGQMAEEDNTPEQRKKAEEDALKYVLDAELTDHTSFQFDVANIMVNLATSKGILRYRTHRFND